MPRTAITPINAPAGYSHTGLVFTWTAADVANGNDFTLTGKEVVLARNVHATLAQTVTITSAADQFGRTKDITAFSIAALGFAVFGQLPTAGWIQSDGKLYLNASTTDIQFAIVKLP